MDEFHRFSDLPARLRRAIFAAAWQSTACGRGSSNRNRLRLVCRDARAAADATTTTVCVQTAELGHTQLDACIRAVAFGQFPALREWRVEMSALLPVGHTHRPVEDAIFPLAKAIPPTLQKLHIQEAPLSRPAAEVLAAALPALRQLTLREDGIDAAILQVLGQGFGPCLELLDLSHNVLHPQGAAILAGIAPSRLPTLRELNLTDTAIGDAGVQALAQVAWPALETLHLGGNQITPEGAAALAACAVRLPALRELSLSENRLSHGLFGHSGVQALTRVVWGTLEVLRLDRNWMGYPDAAALANAAVARLPALRELYLSKNGLGDVGVVALMGMPWGALEVLQLDANNISNAGVAALTHASEAQLPALRCLHLGSNHIDAAGVAALVRRVWPHLQELHLPSNRGRGSDSGIVGSCGVWSLGAAGAHRFPALTTLSLAGNSLWEDGVRALVLKAPWPALRSLDLSGTSIITKGVPAVLAVASRSQLSALRALILGGGDAVCGASIAALAEGDWRHLEALTFCAPRYGNTPNVSGGVNALVAAGAARFPALRSLTLEKLPVSEEQETALGAAWPGASIVIRQRLQVPTLFTRFMWGTLFWLPTVLLIYIGYWAIGPPAIFDHAPLPLLTRPLVVLPPLLLLSLLLGAATAALVRHK